MTAADGGPLAGLRVVELAGLGPAPFAGMLLAQLGADVVRIDRPPRGAALDPRHDLLNRGKRSVALDLKNPEGIEAVLSILDSAHVLIEGFRPGVTERLGLGPDAVRGRNPRLVYGRMTGWGQDGPLAPTAGHDISYIALTGALHAIGDKNGSPQIPLNLLGDFGGGATYLVIGVLAAVREAERTGRGQVVDAAIVDGTAHLMSAIHAMYARGDWIDSRGANLLDGGAPYYSVYATADGRHMAVGAIEPQFYTELIAVLGIDDLDAKDQRRKDTWPHQRERIAAAFAARTQSEWSAAFTGTDACVAPILGLREAADHPHIRVRRTLTVDAEIVHAAPAPRFSEHPARQSTTAPIAGADTRAVLSECGLDAHALVASGAAVQS